MVLLIKRLLNSIYRLLVITSSNTTKHIFNRKQLERCLGEGGLQNSAQHGTKELNSCHKKTNANGLFLFHGKSNYFLIK